MYQFILLHSRDYLCKSSVKVNVATDKENSQNETSTDQRDEIELPEEIWPWVQVELMAYSAVG